MAYSKESAEAALAEDQHRCWYVAYWLDNLLIKLGPNYWNDAVDLSWKVAAAHNVLVNYEEIHSSCAAELTDAIAEIDRLKSLIHG